MVEEEVFKLAAKIGHTLKPIRDINDIHIAAIKDLDCQECNVRCRIGFRTTTTMPFISTGEVVYCSFFLLKKGIKALGKIIIFDTKSYSTAFTTTGFTKQSKEHISKTFCCERYRILL